MTRVTPLLTAAALLLLGGALTACAPAEGGSITPQPESSPPGGDDLEVDAAWLDGGSKVAVLTRGSSSCPPVAEDAVYESGILRLTLAELGDQACTRDYVLRGAAVALPEGIDPSQDLEIEVVSAGARGDVELEGAAGLVPADGLENGGLPTAGWADADGVIALLTWGSSGCPPLVSEAVVSAPNEVTVTFAEPSADRVCTMDFGPRVTVVEVPGADEDTAYELVLQGDGFAGTRITVAGQN